VRPAVVLVQRRLREQRRRAVAAGPGQHLEAILCVSQVIGYFLKFTYVM
jgi:hypothetical protein